MVSSTAETTTNTWRTSVQSVFNNQNNILCRQILLRCFASSTIVITVKTLSPNGTIQKYIATLDVDEHSQYNCIRSSRRRCSLLGRGRITLFCTRMFDILLHILDLDEDLHILCECLIILLGGFLKAAGVSSDFTANKYKFGKEVRITLNVVLRNEIDIHRMPSLNWARRMYSLFIYELMYQFAGTYFSVLGGAYSALGRYDANHAQRASQLALQQVHLARLQGDPVQEAKCWLYFAEGLVNLGRFGQARSVIKWQKGNIDKLRDQTLKTMYNSVEQKYITAKYKHKGSKHRKSTDRNVMGKVKQDNSDNLSTNFQAFSTHVI